MKNFNPYKCFQSGKYDGETYTDVWKKDKGYFHFLAQKGDYWVEIVEELERRDRIFGKPKINKNAPPSTQTIKEIFTKHLICGFDMSDYICAIYEPLNEVEKHLYFNSLKIRNNIT